MQTTGVQLALAPEMRSCQDNSRFYRTFCGDEIELVFGALIAERR
jgi:hypothetical protein